MSVVQADQCVRPAAIVANSPGCYACRVPWHDQLTCEQYKALPADQRQPDDRALAALAKQKGWRACPSCGVNVELTSGCHHISPSSYSAELADLQRVDAAPSGACASLLCVNSLIDSVCGAIWTDNSCPKGCPLWEERRLLDEDAARQAEQDERLAAGREALNFVTAGVGRNRFSTEMVRPIVFFDAHARRSTRAAAATASPHSLLMTRWSIVRKESQRSALTV